VLIGYENEQFLVNLPYNTGNGYIAMNELCASYAVMFFLSELVRYHPHRLDDVAETRDGWPLGSFVKSCPTVVLRMMLNAITGRTIILSRV
jgi:hypothetical protein